MTGTKVNINSNGSGGSGGSSSSDSVAVDDREIGREDLQLMLRSRLDSRLVVLDVEQAALLPPGENFACSIYKIDVKLKRDEDAPEELLHMVAKLYPYVEYVRNIFDFSMFFKKELFFYERLVPALKELDEEFSVKEEPFDLAPRLFGARFSADPKVQEVDDGVIVLMDNLKSKGYYTGDKIEGLDLEHSKSTIISLARFHAYNIACKQHRPDFFNSEVRAHAKSVPYNEENINVFQLMMGMMFADERFVEYQARILESMAGFGSKKNFFEYVAEEPWLGITHFDFWTNNVLFRSNDRGEVVDVKLIDFQNYTYNSPLRDLPYFLCTSTSHEVMTQHFDRLLDLYYETFMATLEILRCDSGAFTRESFDKQIKIDANLEFMHNILAIKFFCAEIDKKTYDPSQLQKVVVCSQINKLGLDKWYQIVLTYIKRGWL